MGRPWQKRSTIEHYPDLTQVSSKFVKRLITDEEFIKIRGLATKPTAEGCYSVDQKTMVHRLLDKRLGINPPSKH